MRKTYIKTASLFEGGWLPLYYSFYLFMLIFTFLLLMFLFVTYTMSPLRGDIGWPARSLDLNPCDFFLWGYLKSKVYINRPRSIKQLKDAVRQEIAAIPQEITHRVIDNFCERLRQRVDNNASHLTHLTDLIFKT